MFKASQSLFLILLLLVPATIFSQSSNDVRVYGGLKIDKVKKGRAVQATVTMEIPPGLHVQSNKPLDKFLVATKLEVETPRGMISGPVSYPRAVMRSLKFSKGQVAVFEGKTVLRFNVTVPASYTGGSGDIIGKLRFQACNDDACFPPVTREVKVWLNVE